MTRGGEGPDEALGILPEAGYRQGSSSPRMAGNSGTVPPFQHLWANREGHKETVSWFPAWTGFLILSLPNQGLDPQQSSSDKALSRKDGLRRAWVLSGRKLPGKSIWLGISRSRAKLEGKIKTREKETTWLVVHSGV